MKESVIAGGQNQNRQNHCTRCHSTKIDTDQHSRNYHPLSCFLSKIEDSEQWSLHTWLNPDDPVHIWFFHMHPLLFILRALCDEKCMHGLSRLDRLNKNKTLCLPSTFPEENGHLTSNLFDSAFCYTLNLQKSWPPTSSMYSLSAASHLKENKSKKQNNPP